MNETEGLLQEACRQEVYSLPTIPRVNGTYFKSNSCLAEYTKT